MILVSILAWALPAAQDPQVPRLTPELVTELSAAATSDLPSRATVVHVLAAPAPGMPADFRLDVLETATVRKLARTYLERRATAAGERSAPPPYVVFFASDTELLTGFRYDLDGTIAAGDGSAVFAAPPVLRELLNLRIEERRDLILARDRFFAAVAREDFATVESLAGAELAERLRERLPELGREGVDLATASTLPWRETSGRRSSYERRGFRRHGQTQPIQGFVSRLKNGDRGPSWWVQVLLKLSAEGWRVEDFRVYRSGSRQGQNRHRAGRG